MVPYSYTMSRYILQLFSLSSKLTSPFVHVLASCQLLDLCRAIFESPVRPSPFDTSAAVNIKVLGSYMQRRTVDNLRALKICCVGASASQQSVRSGLRHSSTLETCYNKAQRNNHHAPLCGRRIDGLDSCRRRRNNIMASAEAS